MWRLAKSYVLLPVWRAIVRLSQPDVRIVTGGVAFYAVFSVFPFLYLSVTLLFGLFPGTVSQQLVASITSTLQSTIIALSEADVRNLLTVTPHQLTLSILLGLLLVLYTASSGAKAAILGIRMIAGTQHKTRFFRFHGLSLMLTAGMVLLVWTLGVVQVAISALAGATGDEATSQLARLLGDIASRLWVTKWLASFVVFYLVITLSLRGHIDSGRSMAAGAAAGSALWMVVTWAFQFYLRISPLDTIYGALASVIAALIWLVTSVSSLLMGAALAAEWDRLAAKGHDDRTGDEDDR